MDFSYLHSLAKHINVYFCFASEAASSFGGLGIAETKVQKNHNHLSYLKKND